MGIGWKEIATADPFRVLSQDLDFFQTRGSKPSFRGPADYRDTKRIEPDQICH
jgi:hypothetical protein